MLSRAFYHSRPRAYAPRRVTQGLCLDPTATPLRMLCSATPPLISVSEVAGAPRTRELKLQKPPVNTFDKHMLELFVQTLHEIEADPDVDGIILTSDNPKVYSAGLDLQSLLQPTEAQFAGFWTALEDFVAAYYTSPLYVVAAIRGSAPALGAILAVGADYRLMEDGEKFRIGLNETSLGMVPPRWLSLMTSRTIGVRQAERHLGGSSMLSPRSALAVGLIDEVCDGSDELMARAVAISVEAGRIPAAARAGYKQSERQCVKDVCGPESVATMAECILSDEFQANLAAIVEKLKNRKK